MATTDDEIRTLPPSWRRTLWGTLPGLLLMVMGMVLIMTFNVKWPAANEVDERSDYSHIRVRKRGSVRELLFVRDNGVEARQSAIDLGAPHKLQSPYVQRMFASYLFQPRPERVLIIGLGGGAMVRFLQYHEPELDVDAVEIDPVVVRLAADYFETRADEHVSIITADGFDFLEQTPHLYDVIYFDAFLKPSADTDVTGVPQRLKTIAFYQSVQKKLRPEGLVVFNLNQHEKTDEDLETIAAAFSQVDRFVCPPSGNLVVVAGANASTPDRVALERRAERLDQRFGANFSFVELLQDRQP